ncbi:MAG: hypothetical protein ACOCPT_04950 [Halanaeroarchaeum sp.]
MFERLDPLATDDWRLSIATWTLVLFAVTGGLVALAQWGVLPRRSLVVGAPAIVVTLLVDTFLYNEYLIDTGPGFWAILYGALFVQSAMVSALTIWTLRVASRWRRRRTESDSRE